MDASTYSDIWVNLATNSPFLGWMIYSYIQTNKALDRTRDESKAEMKELRQERGQRKLFAILEPLKEQIQEIRVKEKMKKELSRGK